MNKIICKIFLIFHVKYYIFYMHINNEFYIFYQIVNATHLSWYYKKDNRAILLI